MPTLPSIWKTPIKKDKSSGLRCMCSRISLDLVHAIAVPMTTHMHGHDYHMYKGSRNVEDTKKGRASYVYKAKHVVL